MVDCILLSFRTSKVTLRSWLAPGRSKSVIDHYAGCCSYTNKCPVASAIGRHRICTVVGMGDDQTMQFCHPGAKLAEAS